MDDPRLLFVIDAVHCMAETGLVPCPVRLKGLAMILEAVVIEWRESQDGLQISV